MSLSTFSGIKAAVASYLGGRTDLTSQIVDAVTLCESRIHYGSESPGMPSKPLRIRAMETALSVTVSAETAALPTGWLGARHAYLSTDPKQPLDFVTPEQMTDMSMGSQTGRPRFFTVEGENFRFAPIPDSTYTMVGHYWKKFTALSGDSDTNWLMTNAPGVYLYGTLIEMMPYTRNDARADVWYKMFTASINGLVNADRQDRFSGSVLVMRPVGVGP